MIIQGEIPLVLALKKYNHICTLKNYLGYFFLYVSTEGPWTARFFVPGKVRVAQKRVVQGTMYVMECKIAKKSAFWEASNMYWVYRVVQVQVLATI